MRRHRALRTLPVLLLAIATLVATPAEASTPPAAPATPATSGAELSASAKAVMTGRAVPVPSATTATSTLTANPDGTFTSTTTAQPTRRLINGAWTPLDATLHVNSDGTIGPKVASAGLTLSGGGSGALATMRNATHTFGLTIPMSLPKPTLSGDTATYAGVLPGVDLVVTADTQGGFREVMVVHDAAAAANPKLSTLAFATHSNDLSLRADTAGNLAAADRHGRIVVTAPAPRMWDSSRSATKGTQVIAPDGTARDAASGAPIASSASGPGGGAKVGRLRAAITTGGFSLTPDQSLLRGPGVTYPVFLDPSFQQPSTNDKETAGWATVNAYYASTNYWKNTPDPGNFMQVGDGTAPDGGAFVSRSLFILPIQVTKLRGATISSATVNTFETTSWSCTTSEVDIYAPSTALTSGNATWNYWNSSSVKATWGSVVNAKTVAHGYTGCAAASVGFDVKSTVNADVGLSRTSQTFMLKAADEGTNLSWKEFDKPSTNPPSLTVVYNHPPTGPSSLQTVPATSCTGTLTTLGNGPVSLTAIVSDPDGGTVGATFTLKNHSTGAVVQQSSAQSTYTTSGNRVTFALDPATLLTAAGGVNGTTTQFDWTVIDTDYSVTSSATGPCSFLFNPAPTGQPGVAESGTATVGQPATFNLTTGGSGPIATGFLVQLNTAPAVLWPATSGSATVTVTPTRQSDTLVVTGVSAGNNIGQPSKYQFDADPPAAAESDGDLTGDGKPDLVTVGGTGTGLPAGIWQANGTSTSLDPTVANIGVNGDYVTGDRSPSDFNGAHVVTGIFDTSGPNLQDLLVYYTGGTREGGGEILDTPGDGSPLNPGSGSVYPVPTGAFDDSFDYPTTAPMRQLVNAGATSQRVGAAPDLIGVGGDASNGYAVWYYFGAGTGAFDGPYPIYTAGNPPTPTPLAPPSGTWDQWTLASAQTSSGTVLYLWKRSTGDLYLWSNLAETTDNSSNVTLTYTQKLIKTGWNTTAVSIQAADIDHDASGTVDIWALSSTGMATANLISNLSGTPVVTTQSGKQLLTSDHSWSLSDLSDTLADGSPVTTTYDVPGTSSTEMDATGAGNAVWNRTDDQFSPDVSFDGTTGTALVTTGTPVNTHGAFTVSAWVKPQASGGTILSEEGTNVPAFKLFVDPGTSSWEFATTSADVASPTWRTVWSSPNSVEYGVWTHIVAYYDGTTYIHLIVNDINFTSTQGVLWTAPGPLRIGGSALTNWFHGEIANVQVWNHVPGTSLVGEYRMLDLSGTTAKDTGPLVRNATLTTGASFTNTGHRAATQGSLVLNGTTGCAATSSAIVNTSQSYTVGAWVKLDTLAKYQTFIGEDGTTISSFFLQVDSSNHWRFRIYAGDSSSSVFATATATSVATANTWTHIVGVYDAVAHTVAIYINGTLEQSSAVTSPPAWTPSGSLTIGRARYNSASTDWVDGNIDTVQVYQEALSSAQVLLMYSTSK